MAATASLFVISLPTSVDRFQASAETRCSPFRAPVLSRASTPTPAAVSSLKQRLRDAIRPLDRGFAIGADDALTPEEEVVEDAVESLEGLSEETIELPALKAGLDGSWELIYTSSGTSRYTGGLSGLAGSLPGGKSERVYCTINTEECEAEYSEDIVWSFGKFAVNVKGDIKLSENGTMVWAPGKVRVGKWPMSNSAWRSIRAFAFTKHTYLSEDLDIARGPTGALMIFKRINKRERPQGT